MLWLFALLICCSALSNVQCEVKEYRNFCVLGVVPTTEDQLQYLIQLSKEDDVVFWQGPNPIGVSSRVMISPGSRNEIEEELSARNIDYSVQIEDVQEQIDEERNKMQSSRKEKQFDFMDFFKDYHWFPEIMNYIEKLRFHYPNFTSAGTIGETYQGNKLRLIKIGRPKTTSKPMIWIDGLLNGREWISGMVALYIANRLSTQSKFDPIVETMIDHFDWYILPVANPDGYKFTQKLDRFWTKNLKPLPNNKSVGVDLNRNFDHFWNTSNDENVGNPDKCVYQGPKPFSEYESNAIAKFLNKRWESLKVYISLHSFGQLWLTPYGQQNSKPDNYLQMVNIAEVGNEGMASQGTRFQIGPAYEFRPSTGSSMDWVKYYQKTEYSYALYLDNRTHLIETPREDILRIGEEVWRAVQEVVIELIRRDIKRENA